MTSQATRQIPDESERVRTTETIASVTRICGLTINPDNNEVLIGGRPVSLTGSEFRLLHLLTSHVGRAFTRRQIIDAIQGYDYPATDRTVDVHVTGLRRKLGRLGDRIETVRGVGYKFRE